MKKYRDRIKTTRLNSTVDIVTNPPNASIYIDGKRLTPVTPFRGFIIPAGIHRTIVRKEGYFEIDRKFFLKYGENLKIEDLVLKSKKEED